MKKLFFIFLLGITLIGCEKKGGETQDTIPINLAKNYISRFVDCAYIHVETYENYLFLGFDVEKPRFFIRAFADNDTTNSYKNMYNGLYFDSHIVKTGYWDGRSLDDPYYNEKRRIYYEYINQIGDTCFNRMLPGGLSPVCDAITVPLRSISITCDKDINSDFPAGSELNSLFTVVFDDLYATIKNSYKTVEGSYPQPKSTPEWEYDVDHSYFKEKLSAVDFPRHPFIWNTWLCILDTVPNKTGEYTFHVKVTQINGNEMESTSVPITIKGIVD